MSVGLQKGLYVVHEAKRRELNLDQTQQIIPFYVFIWQVLAALLKLRG